MGGFVQRPYRLDPPRYLGPDGIFVDGSGTLYVANADESGNDKVTVYPRGAHKPSRVYAGAVCAFDVVAGTNGAVYVADACGIHGRGRVIVFAHGSRAPTSYIYPGGSPYSLTLDSENNLYVGYNSYEAYWGQVKRYAPGAEHGRSCCPKNLFTFSETWKSITTVPSLFQMSSMD